MIYRNGRASKKIEREKTKTPDMQTSVDQSANISTPLIPPDKMNIHGVSKYGGEDSNSDLDSVDEELGVVKAEASTKTPLKQDNIAPEEVVVSWSYKDYRVAKKIEYV
ncbi:hypothetical protein RhiirC2_771475 [Rhizophagus irregularis]|uniref:Uncharacterized protein n=1 Tax=Rhizophagus irregularis TaxID=588596 RepID=A0A2N1NTV5_9GLOM|nr:hypothetical protein RhiirC2_771475 [Rhizophagus irregularis]